MYYRMTLPASSLKELSPYIFGKPHDPSAAGSLFVTMADLSTREYMYHQMSTMGL